MAVRDRSGRVGSGLANAPCAGVVFVPADCEAVVLSDRAVVQARRHTLKSGRYVSAVSGARVR
jgi:hypothetical protein